MNIDAYRYRCKKWGTQSFAQKHTILTTHTHTHTNKQTHTLYVLLFIRNVVGASYIKCVSLKPNFTFLVIFYIHYVAHLHTLCGTFTCIMQHVYMHYVAHLRALYGTFTCIMRHFTHIMWHIYMHYMAHLHAFVAHLHVLCGTFTCIIWQIYQPFALIPIAGY
jgi:hypothetical protein